jgi:pimeloyl-ACP methyl ester carboxylesterase
LNKVAPLALLSAVIAIIVILAGAFAGDKDEPASSVSAPPAAPTTEAIATPSSDTPLAVPATSPEPTTASAPPIDWQPCDSGFDCADYAVPLDYSDPNARTITLALRRLPAADPSKRVGLLFANPGGPGGSAIDILSGWARSLPEDLRDRFDVILFDPRGVGHSSPLICHDNIKELIGLNPYPATDDDWKTIEDATLRQVNQCEQVGGDILPFLGTKDVARDMDRIREAEGEDTITYFGYSYGTTLGQVYADMYPTHVRAMVLDGAVDIGLETDERSLEQTLAFEASFDRYLDYCAARSCLPGDPLSTIEGLLNEAAEKPLDAPLGDRPVGPGEIIYGIVQSMYTPAYRPILTSALRAALDDDASGLLFLADSYAGRNNDGTYANGTETNSAVNCLDYVTHRDPMHARELSSEFGQVAPFFGPATGEFDLFCAYWPADPKPLSTPVAAGAPPIMVIGGTGDPATPYKWAVSVADELQSGFLVTRDAEGHTAYRQGDSCIDDAVNDYLADLTIPPEGLTCGNAGIAPVPPVP